MLKTTVLARTLNICALVIVTLALPAESLAQMNNIAPVDNTLQGLINILTGTIGTSIAVLGVIFVGLLAFVGRMSWAVAGAVIGGIVLVFGAPAIVTAIQGGL